MSRTVTFLGVVLATSVGLSTEQTKKTWSFDDQAVGKLPAGFSSEVGMWAVADGDDGKVLAQTAENPNSVFNVLLINDTSFTDVDMSVKFQAVAGGFDRGGGLIWRARDARNYYVARYNPLEDNFRLYHVVAGRRTLIENADIKHTAGWHTLRVVMHGKHIECYYDGKRSLETDDDTLTGPGKVGLWTKADAQTNFDDLAVTGQ